MFSLNKHQQRNDIPSSAWPALPVGARKVEAPHQRRKSWWQLGSRWDSLAWLPGNPTPSLTNTGQREFHREGLCVYTAIFSAGLKHKCLCFRKDKAPGRAKLVGIRVTLWTCRGEGKQAPGPEGLLRMAHFHQVLGHLVVVWV